MGSLTEKQAPFAAPESKTPGSRSRIGDLKSNGSSWRADRPSFFAGYGQWLVTVNAASTRGL